jgi:hypothetical protein
MMAQSGIHVYVASKARPTKIALWRALSGAGLPMASWIDSEINGDDHELTPERWSRHWVRCLEQAADADICLFYAPEGGNPMWIIDRSVG